MVPAPLPALPAVAAEATTVAMVALLSNAAVTAMVQPTKDRLMPRILRQPPMQQTEDWAILRQLPCSIN
jgi:hypothetical protein